MKVTKLLTAVAAFAAVSLSAGELFNVKYESATSNPPDAGDKNKTAYVFSPNMSQLGNCEKAEVKDGKLYLTTGPLVKGAAVARFHAEDNKIFAGMIGKKLQIKMTIAAEKSCKVTLFFEGNVPETADKDAHFWRAKEYQITDKSQEIEITEPMPDKGVIKDLWVRLDYDQNIPNTYIISKVSMTALE